MSSITASAPSVASASFAANRPSYAEGRGRYARFGLATVFATVLANILVYFVGDAIVDYNPDFLVLANVSGIAIFTFAAAVVAVLLYGALLRFARNPVRTFTIVAAVVFVVTTVPDFTYIPGVDGASNGQTAVLVATHVVAAAVIVGMLTTFARPTRKA